MQVNKITENVSAVPDIIRQNGTKKSSQFQQLLQEKISPMGKMIPGMDSSENQRAPQRVCLGTISSKFPTVSHLLYASSHEKECWDILDKEVNSKKPFTRIPSGTPIYMDTRTSEIIWKSSSPESMSSADRKNAVASEFNPEPDARFYKVSEKSKIPFDSKPLLRKQSDMRDDTLTSSHPPVENSFYGLDQAVGAFIGTPYSRMNCYELVVKGLERMGVQYGGKDGLSQHLMDQASREGLSAYSLHSGEGISEALGSDVFMESFLHVKNVNSQVREVMTKMGSVLQEGQILSFSTPTKGHTGVISKKDGKWTFINSGVMDHNLSGKNGGWAVGEEQLGEEIKNWFHRAQKEGKGLTITLGTVDTSKLAQFEQRPLESLSHRV